MSRFKGRNIAAVAVSVGFLLVAGGFAGQTQAQPGGDHPDLNGIYFPARSDRPPTANLPFTPAAREMWEYWEANFRIEDEPGRFCVWPGMPRAPWGAPFPIEIFHRDYDVTIYWEGYGMFRKI